MLHHEPRNVRAGDTDATLGYRPRDAARADAGLKDAVADGADLALKGVGQPAGDIRVQGARGVLEGGGAVEAEATLAHAFHARAQ